MKVDMQRNKPLSLMVKLLKRFIRDEQGQVLILFVITSVILLGIGAFAVDVGYLNWQKRQLQNIADAAALAGARELADGNIGAVEAAVQDYVEANGGDISEIDSIDIDGSRVSVELKANRGLFLAQVFGLNSAVVAAGAGAETSREGDVVPFSISAANLPFNPGQEYLLKCSQWKKTDIGPGNFGALALGGNGANNYRDNIKNGYSGPISIGQWLTTETGNMAGPTQQGVDYRLSHGKSKVYVIIYDEVADKPGRTEIKVMGFAPFEITGVDNNGNVTGIFSEVIYDESELGAITLVE
ncbi:MAG TPA: pilus assembly protein [Firmicutes bacterium]|nr:pilus assembly protein [Bacillota bacterium]